MTDRLKDSKPDSLHDAQGAENAQISESQTRATHFILQRIEADRAAGKHGGRVATRFPPEPNGYLHIGHARAIWINFSIAKRFQGTCNLRFDDTNPIKEESQFAEGIKEDIHWLGYEWSEERASSQYFAEFYTLAQKLIRKGLAYVCDLTAEEIRATRGTLQKPGQPSPYRNRSVEENLDLFERMKNGEFPDGSKTLRAKIDMNAGNINMRDPALYRVRHATHHATGNAWCIYPMYDWAHGLSDAIEGITHSLCSLEFQDHRPLYDWFLEATEYPHRPQQIEFARLNISYTVTSKRKLKLLIDHKKVEGWDDPRMPTIRGYRRRGVPPQAILNFCEKLGVSKKDTVIDYSILEDEIRSYLNEFAPRLFAVSRPLKVKITNWTEGQVQELKAPVHPQKPEMGERSLYMSGTLWIEKDDFMEDAPKKFFRLAPGREVRLRYGYIVRCDEVIRDELGNIVQLNCTYDPNTLGQTPEGRKVKGVIHWLSDSHSQKATIREYDRLFQVADPKSAETDEEFLETLNPSSMTVISEARVEPIGIPQAGMAWQFERQGYYAVDPSSAEGSLVLNRVVTLRETWTKSAVGSLC